MEIFQFSCGSTINIFRFFWSEEKMIKVLTRQSKFKLSNSRIIEKSQLLKSMTLKDYVFFTHFGYVREKQLNLFGE